MNIKDDNYKLYLDSKGLQYFFENLTVRLLDNKIDEVESPEEHKLYVRNGYNKSWEELIFPDPEVKEANKDGELYGRKDGKWDKIIIPEVPVKEAPFSNELYGRKDGKWNKIIIPEVPVKEAPVDNNQYLRKNGNWEKFILPSPVKEAPIDDDKYIRRNGRWESIEAPMDGRYYMRRDGHWEAVGDITIDNNPDVPNPDIPGGGGIHSNDNEVGIGPITPTSNFPKLFVNTSKKYDLNNTLPQASNDVLGGIKLGFAQIDKKYPVQLENGRAYVEVPWSGTGGMDMVRIDESLIDKLP